MAHACNEIIRADALAREREKRGIAATCWRIRTSNNLIRFSRESQAEREKEAKKKKKTNREEKSYL